MRKMSYRAMKIYREAYRKVSEELLRATKSSNIKLLSEAVGEIIKLNIHELMGVDLVHIWETKERLEEIRRKVLEDPAELITAEEVRAVLDLLIMCLDAGIVPDSCLVIGSGADQMEEYHRIRGLLEEKDLIEEG